MCGSQVFSNPVTNIVKIARYSKKMSFFLAFLQDFVGNIAEKRVFLGISFSSCNISCKSVFTGLFAESNYLNLWAGKFLHGSFYTTENHRYTMHIWLSSLCRLLEYVVGQWLWLSNMETVSVVLNMFKIYLNGISQIFSYHAIVVSHYAL